MLRVRVQVHPDFTETKSKEVKYQKNIILKENHILYGGISDEVLKYQFDMAVV